MRGGLHRQQCFMVSATPKHNVLWMQRHAGIKDRQTARDVAARSSNTEVGGGQGREQATKGIYGGYTAKRLLRQM